MSSCTGNYVATTAKKKAAQVKCPPDEGTGNIWVLCVKFYFKKSSRWACHRKVVKLPFNCVTTMKWEEFHHVKCPDWTTEVIQIGWFHRLNNGSYILDTVKQTNKQTTGFDVHGSMHHSTIHTEKSNKMQQCIKIYYSIFIWSSTCFGRHTAHRQEPKTALAASGLHTWKVVGRVIAGCCQAENLWYSAWQRPVTTRPTTFHVCKPEAASAVLGSWQWAVCCPKHVELHTNAE